MYTDIGDSALCGVCIACTTSLFALQSVGYCLSRRILVVNLCALVNVVNLNIIRAKYKIAVTSSQSRLCTMLFVIVSLMVIRYACSRISLSSREGHMQGELKSRLCEVP